MAIMSSLTRKAFGVLVLALLIGNQMQPGFAQDGSTTTSAETDVDDPYLPELEFAFEETVTLGADVGVGETPYGGRNIVPITGGTFSGPRINGTVMAGGWDWQLERSDGCTVLEADYMLRTDDGVVINVLNKGIACTATDGNTAPVYTMAFLEAPTGQYEWLNKAPFVGMVRRAQGELAVHIRFYALPVGLR